MRNPSFFFAPAGWRSAAVALLLLFLALASGCATVGLGGGEAAGQDGPKEGKLPFPAPRATSPLEPTVVSFPNYRDPLIGLNRVVFSFNDFTYRYFLIPLSKGYVRAVPDPVRQGVDNFFFNIKTPIFAANHLLQVRVKPLGRDLLRFGLNSTVGILGLFDPARSWFDLEREETHFDDTLAHYHAGYGIYLVLPIFGPSDLRNASSQVTDYFLNPITYLADNPARSAIQSFDFFQEYAPGAERYEILREKSEDPYIFFRNLYLQGIQRDVNY